MYGGEAIGRQARNSKIKQRRSFFRQRKAFVMNILGIIREQLSPETMGQISKSVSENPERIKAAIKVGASARMACVSAEMRRTR
jgi:hypothetical protein